MPTLIATTILSVMVAKDYCVDADPLYCSIYINDWLVHNIAPSYNYKVRIVQLLRTSTSKDFTGYEETLLLHISLLQLFFIFYWCKSDASTIEDDGAKYHWVINVKNPQYSTPSRRADNKDGTRYEDAVHSLAMLIFNSSTGAKVGAYFNNQVGSGVPATHAFSVKLSSGSMTCTLLPMCPICRAN